MANHRFSTPSRIVEWMSLGDDVEITVHYGAADHAADDAVLPQFGSLIKSPSLAVSRARKHGRVGAGLSRWPQQLSSISNSE
jgi:hypothetical protein